MLSVCVSPHSNFYNLTNFHKTWCGRYAFGCHPIIVLYFPAIGYNNMAEARNCEVGARLTLNVFLKLYRPIDLRKICKFCFGNLLLC
jgi:hypothetical protein